MKKILVVDDIDTNRRLLRQLLGSIKDTEVVEAVNGKEAISVYKNEDPDLILMDINMPEMDGYESASAIKKIMGSNYTPIIFVTALSESSLKTALASGGDDFISKPFNVEILESKINAHLRIRELNRQLNEKNLELIHEQDLIEHFFESALKKSFLDKNIIKFHMSSMSTFNGDLFLVARAPQGGMYVVMGDFTGHGLTASMGTLPVAMIFFKMAKKGVTINDMAREVNHHLHELMPTGMFFAATLLELNASGDMMSVWMGGMPEVYWLGKKGELKGVINAQHLPLGIQKDSDFDDATNIYNVEKGDKIYMYSDGVIEASAPDNDMFGNDQLRDALIKHGRNRFENVLSELEKFAGTKDQNDDITLVEMTCADIPAMEQLEEAEDNKSFLLPWKTSVSITVKEIREQDPVSELSDMLGSLPAMKRHKGILHIILSEMYANSIDHSVLGLESSSKENEEKFTDYYKERDASINALESALIDFEFEFIPDLKQGCLKITIKDNGRGYLKAAEKNEDNMLHGRGLEIISSFCESVSFSDDGRSTQVVYKL